MSKRKFTGQSAIRSENEVTLSRTENGVVKFVRVVTFPVWYPVSLIKDFILRWAMNQFGPEDIEQVEQEIANLQEPE